MKQSTLIHGTWVSDDTIVDNLFAKVGMDTLCLKNRTLAWEIANGGDASALEAQIAQYNQYVAKLEQNKEFCTYMKQHGFCLEKSKVAQDLGDAFAQGLFSLSAYPFETVLTVQGNWFVPLGIGVDCTIEVADKSVAFTVGESNEGYPGQSEGGLQQYLWDWSEDLRDFTFYLYGIFEEAGLLPDDTEEYDHYECYDQGREVMEHPSAQLLAALTALEEAGYLATYAVDCPQAQGWFHCRGRQDGTIGFAILDGEFAQNAALVAQLREYLQA